MKELSCDEIRRAVHGCWLAAGGAATVRGVNTDSRKVRPGELFIALSGERFDGHDYLAQAIALGATAALVRKDYRPAAGLPKPPGGLIGVADTTAALGELGAYHRGLSDAKVIAVTGSNGKTTVKRMIHHILATRLRGSCSPKSFNNQIGVPLTLLGVSPGDDYVVCEVGSNAPGEVAALARMCRPDIAVVTSVGPTHLEKLGGIEGVAVEKASILGELAEGGIGIVWSGAGAEALEKAIRVHGRNVVRFGEDENCEIRLTDYQAAGWRGHLAAGSSSSRERRRSEETEEARGRDARDTRGQDVRDTRGQDVRDTRGQDVRDTHGRDALATTGSRFQVNGRLWVTLPAPGRHNALNALAALAVAQQFGMTLEEAGEALAGFEGAEMRLQPIPAGPVTILNDAYNANPASVAAAASVLAEQPAGRRVFVAGDMLELGEGTRQFHLETGRQIARRGVDYVIGVGMLGRLIAEGAAQAGVRAEQVASVEEAMGLLPALLRPGDVVLVKGSRGMAMERLVGPIRSAFDPAAEGEGSALKGRLP
jgi:UDP-N-acetylmuramoyl-tripeptide--D-alanyl-D-alanine ligase